MLQDVTYQAALNLYAYHTLILHSAYEYANIEEHIKDNLVKALENKLFGEAQRLLSKIEYDVYKQDISRIELENIS